MTGASAENLPDFFATASPEYDKINIPLTLTEG
jgi:hypothetical protein